MSPAGEQDVLRRCGLSEIATPGWTVAEDVDAYAARGFAAIGLWLHKLERGAIEGFFIPEATIPGEVVASTAARVRAAGLTVSHLVLTGFYTEPELAGRRTLGRVTVIPSFRGSGSHSAPNLATIRFTAKSKSRSSVAT